MKKAKKQYKVLGTKSNPCNGNLIHIVLNRAQSIMIPLTAVTWIVNQEHSETVAEVKKKLNGERKLETSSVKIEGPRHQLDCLITSAGFGTTNG